MHITINLELRSLGSPEILPATQLYERLLAEGTRRPLGSNKLQDPGVAIEWLPAALADDVSSLFKSGHWLHQEGLRLTGKAPKNNNCNSHKK